MDIRAGKYHLTTDGRSYVLSEIGISKSGKTKGEEVVKDSTFHPTLGCAINALLGRKIKESEATTLQELKDDHKRAVEWISGLFNSEYGAV